MTTNTHKMTTIHARQIHLTKMRKQRKSYGKDDNKNSQNAIWY